MQQAPSSCNHYIGVRLYLSAEPKFFFFFLYAYWLFFFLNEISITSFERTPPWKTISLRDHIVYTPMIHWRLKSTSLLEDLFLRVVSQKRDVQTFNFALQNYSAAKINSSGQNNPHSSASSADIRRRLKFLGNFTFKKLLQCSCSNKPVCF